MSNETTSHDLVPISRAAKILGVSIDTLRRWDLSGQLVAVRLPSGHRRYRLSDLDAFTDKASA